MEFNKNQAYGRQIDISKREVIRFKFDTSDKAIIDRLKLDADNFLPEGTVYELRKRYPTFNCEKSFAWYYSSNVEQTEFKPKEPISTEYGYYVLGRSKSNGI